jgi:hypothetical protein
MKRPIKIKNGKSNEGYASIRFVEFFDPPLPLPGGDFRAGVLQLKTIILRIIL